MADTTDSIFPDARGHDVLVLTGNITLLNVVLEDRICCTSDSVVRACFRTYSEENVQEAF